MRRVSPVIKWLIAGVGLLAVVGVLTVILLVRSDDRQTASEVQVLNTVVDSVGLAQVGQVVDDEQAGRAGLSTDRPSRTVVVISGNAGVDLNAVVEARLRQANFGQNGLVWQRGEGGNTVTVNTTTLKAGAQLPASSSVRAVPANAEGIEVQFIVTPS